MTVRLVKLSAWYVTELREGDIRYMELDEINEFLACGESVLLCPDMETAREILGDNVEILDGG